MLGSVQFGNLMFARGYITYYIMCALGHVDKLRGNRMSSVLDGRTV